MSLNKNTPIKDIIAFEHFIIAKNMLNNRPSYLWDFPG